MPSGVSRWLSSVASCSPVESDRRFGGGYCFHFEGRHCAIFYHKLFCLLKKDLNSFSVLHSVSNFDVP